MCQHRNNDHTHTCSGFYNTNIVYCVHCMWEKFDDYTPAQIDLDRLPTPSEITWDGELTSEEYRNYHLQRINAADLSFPILISDDYEIIDGCHRIHKAHSLNRIYINAIILTQHDLEKCVF